MTDWLVADSLAPHTDGALARLYQASGRRELAMPFCGGCGLVLELEQLRCDACAGTDIAWRALEPAGTVHSVTTVHRREAGLILTRDPSCVIDVELSSGRRLIMTTDRPTTTTPRLGDPARIVFRHAAGVAIPAFAVPDRTRLADPAAPPDPPTPKVIP